MNIRTQIMALPAEDRLPVALDLLDEFMSHDVQQIEWIRRKLGISPMAAKMVLILNRAAPRVVTRDMLMVAMWGHDCDHILKNLHVYKHRINAVRPGLVSVAHGVGYFIEKPMQIGALLPKQPPRLGLIWTRENDEDLRRMVASGSTVASIAYELDRSERAVSDRIRKLGVK